jgi:hypothetical protein
MHVAVANFERRVLKPRTTIRGDDLCAGTHSRWPQWSGKTGLAVVLSLLVFGCTTVRVQPVDRSIRLTHVCIQENPKVIVPSFLNVVRDGFERHGISTEVFSGSPPPTHCEYVLTYTALQSWDLALFLSHAELRLEHEGRKVADAEYHLTGGLSLMKWQSTRTKMDPVIDELLKAY